MTSAIITVYQCFHYKPLLLRALKLTHKNSLRIAAWSTNDKQIFLPIFELEYVKSRLKIKRMRGFLSFRYVHVYLYVYILRDGSEAFFSHCLRKCYQKALGK